MANYELNMLNTTTVKDLTVTARPIYGSSRLGVDSRRVILWQNGTNVSTDTPTVIKNRILSMKQYELSNHLGNVLVTVSDKRIAKSYGVSTVDYFEPEITTISDYYAFGSPMPTRTWSDPNSKYKYGFNGKEKDNEVNVEGGDYDFGARIYDSRLGRFQSIDFLAKSFPWYSPYQYAGNDVLRCIDLDGMEKIDILVLNNPQQPFISQATINITMQYTAVTSGRGAITGLDPVAFHNQWAEGNGTYFFSSLPSATSQGVLISGRERRWATKAINGSQKHIEKLASVGIGHIYVAEVQYDYTLSINPNVTLENAVSWKNTDNVGRGIIMDAIPNSNMSPSDGVLQSHMTDANILFSRGYVGYGSNAIDHFCILNPMSNRNLKEKTDDAVHESGHNAASTFVHDDEHDHYTYLQQGLQSSTHSAPSAANTLDLLNDSVNKSNTTITIVVTKSPNTL